MRKTLVLICCLSLAIGATSSCESCLGDLKMDYELLQKLWYDYQDHQNFTEDFLELAKKLLHTYDDCYIEHAFVY